MPPRGSLPTGARLGRSLPTRTRPGAARSLSRMPSPASKIRKLRFLAVRTPTRKYVKYSGGLEELYDLATDPYELHNEAANASYAADLASLRGLHDKLATCAGPSCWIP